MKRCAWIVCLIAVPALAQTATAPARGERGDRARRGQSAGEGRGESWRGGFGMDQQMQRLETELNLTQEQQTAIRKVLDDHRQKMQEQFRTRMTANREKIGTIREQMAAARAAGDQAKLDELEQQMRDLVAGQGQLAESRKELLSAIEAKLTPEQKPKFEKIKGDLLGGRPSLEQSPTMLLQAVESLKLPPEQMQKIRGMVNEWQQKRRNAQDPQIRREEAGQVYKRVMNELTPEQQAKLKEWRPTIEPGARGERSGREGGQRAGRGRGAGGSQDGQQREERQGGRRGARSGASLPGA